MKKKLKIVFRVDGNKKIGLGHLNRCISLARQFKKDGHLVSFVSNITTQSFFPTNFKIPTHFIHRMDDITYFEKCDLLIIDSYQLNHIYEKKIKGRFKLKILVIDDFVNRKHLCDFYLNQNVPPRSKILHITSKYKPMLGSQFALIDPSFFKKKKKYSSVVKKILINFGSNDQRHLFIPFLRALKRISYNENIDVILGYAQKHQHLKTPPNITIYHFIHMKKFLKESDLAIGGCGISALERCAMGVPSISISLSKDQIANAKYLHHKKATIYIGHWNQLAPNKLSRILKKMIQNTKFRTFVAKSASNVCDGKGPYRVAQKIYKALKI